VGRLAAGSYRASEVAERLAQVELVGDREQAAAGHPQQAIRLVYRLLHRIQSSSPPADGRSLATH